MHRLALKLIWEKHGVTADAPAPTKKCRKQKARELVEEEEEDFQMDYGSDEEYS